MLATRPWAWGWGGGAWGWDWCGGECTLVRLLGSWWGLKSSSWAGLSPLQPLLPSFLLVGAQVKLLGGSLPAPAAPDFSSTGGGSAPLVGALRGLQGGLELADGSLLTPRMLQLLGLTGMGSGGACGAPGAWQWLWCGRAVLCRAGDSLTGEGGSGGRGLACLSVCLHHHVTDAASAAAWWGALQAALSGYTTC